MSGREAVVMFAGWVCLMGVFTRVLIRHLKETDARTKVEP